MRIIKFLVSSDSFEKSEEYDNIEPALYCAIQHLPAKIRLCYKYNPKDKYIVDWTATIKKGGKIKKEEE